VLFQNFAVLELASNYLQMFLHRHQYQVTNENEYLRGYLELNLLKPIYFWGRKHKL
jgi:hypothetical protein